MLLIVCNELAEFRLSHARTSCWSSTLSRGMEDEARRGRSDDHAANRSVGVLASDVLLEQIAQAGAARGFAGAVTLHRLVLLVDLLRLDRQGDGAALAI